MIYLFYLISSSVIWATTPIFVKISLMYDVNPITLAFFRLFFGTLILYIICRNIILNRDIIILSVFGLGLNFLSYHGGLYFTTSAAAQFLESLSIIFVIFLLKVFKEKISKYEYLAATLAFIGVFMIFYAHYSFQKLVIGDFLELLAAISWAFFIVKSKHILKNMKELELLFNVYLISALFLSPSLILFNINKYTIMFSFVMSIFHTIIAYRLYYTGIKHSSPVAAAISFNLSPVITLILSKILLNEYITIEFLFGCILILMGLFITVFSKSSNRQ